MGLKDRLAEVYFCVKSDDLNKNEIYRDKSKIFFTELKLLCGKYLSLEIDLHNFLTHCHG